MAYGFLRDGFPTAENIEKRERPVRFLGIEMKEKWWSSGIFAAGAILTAFAISTNDDDPLKQQETSIKEATESLCRTVDRVIALQRLNAFGKEFKNERGLG